MTNRLSSAIVARFETDAPIPLSQLLEWFSLQDLELRGLIYAYLNRPGALDRVQPAIDVKSYDAWVLKYLFECFEINQESEWIHSRYEACWDLASWFKLKLKAEDLQFVTELKHFLEIRLKEDPKSYEAIVNGILEHVVKESGASKVFKSWAKDPVLSKALSDARL
jgi:hypothetical protein